MAEEPVPQLPSTQLTGTYSQSHYMSDIVANPESHGSAGQYVGGLHRIADDEKSNQKIHVFAFGGESNFGDHQSSKWYFKVEVPIGPVIFVLKGYIDLLSLIIKATFSVKIPIIGEYSLANVEGSLTAGVAVSFGISGIVTGKAKFYIKDEWLYMDLSAEIFGQEYGPLTLKLVPIPI